MEHNLHPTVKKLTISYTEQIIKELAPEELKMVSPLVEVYSENAFRDVNLSENTADNFMGIGAPDLITTLAVPIIVEVVKTVVLPYITQKRNMKSPTLPKAGISDLKIIYDEKSKELTLKVKGKNRKKIEAVLRALQPIILKELEN